ncbi:MAG: hypothetical protein M3O91_10240 [Chloroflexota bacterium]|nr:hypothetical protein [Chloroflexota bacterium]
MPQLPQIHIDQALTNVAIRYSNPEYVAERLSPIIPVGKRSGRFFVYGKEHLKVYETRRAPKSKAAEVDYTLSNSPFFAEEHALSELVTDAESRYADPPIQPEIDATERVTDSLKLGFENDVATKLTDPAQVTQTTALSGTAQWSDYTNSTPLTNIVTAKNAIRGSIIKPANTLLVPYEVGLTLADHPSIKDLLKYTDPRSITTSGLPPVVRGLQVVEALAMQNTANEGQAFTGGRVWGKNAVVLYVAPSITGEKTVTTLVTFEAPDDTTGGRSWQTRRWRDEFRKGDMVEVARTYDLQFIAAGGAYLFTTAIA